MGKVLASALLLDNSDQLGTHHRSSRPWAKRWLLLQRRTTQPHSQPSLWHDQATHKLNLEDKARQQPDLLDKVLLLHIHQYLQDLRHHQRSTPLLDKA